MAWSSVTGVDQRGRWRLREVAGGRTRVEFRFAYGVAGAGITGYLSERVAAPSLRRHLRRSLQQLKRQVEHERLRQEAARRRAEREASDRLSEALEPRRCSPRLRLTAASSWLLGHLRAARDVELLGVVVELLAGAAARAARPERLPPRRPDEMSLTSSCASACATRPTARLLLVHGPRGDLLGAALRAALLASRSS